MTYLSDTDASTVNQLFNVTQQIQQTNPNSVSETVVRKLAEFQESETGSINR